MNLEQRVGTKVTLRGVAEDDAACAIVEVDDIGCDVYLVELASWGKDRGKRVEVTGTLRYRQIGREAAAEPSPGDQLAVHGMVGKRYVLEGATWKLV